VGGDYRSRDSSGEQVFGGGPDLADTRAVRAVGVAVPSDEVLQRQLVDPVVVLGGDAIGVGLPVLAEQDERGGIRGLGGEHQVEQDERVGIPAVGHREQVQRDPCRHDHRLDDDEPPGPEHPGDSVGDPFPATAPVQAPFAGCRQRGEFPAPADGSPVVVMSGSVTVCRTWLRRGPLVTARAPAVQRDGDRHRQRCRSEHLAHPSPAAF
jgi:hypothetical protein